MNLTGYLKLFWTGKYGQLIVMGVILVLAWIVYRWAKVQARKASGGEGTIPSGWSPMVDAAALNAAFAGWGTDEEAVWNILSNKNSKQLELIYNTYLTEYGKTLFEVFDSELSGEDLSRAYAYFSGLTI